MLAGCQLDAGTADNSGVSRWRSHSSDGNSAAVTTTTTTPATSEVIINLPSREVSPRSPRTTSFRRPEPLTPEAMKRVKYLTAHMEPLDSSKLSPISPQYPTSDLGSSPRSSISVITSGWSQFRDQRSSSDFTDGDSDCKDLFSPGVMLSPSPFSPFSEAGDTDVSPGHYHHPSPSPSSGSSLSVASRFRFSFDPKSPSYVTLNKSIGQFPLPVLHQTDPTRERSSSDSDSLKRRLEGNNNNNNNINNNTSSNGSQSSKMPSSPRISVIEANGRCSTLHQDPVESGGQGVKKRLLQRFLKSDSILQEDQTVGESEEPENGAEEEATDQSSDSPAKLQKSATVADLKLHQQDYNNSSPPGALKSESVATFCQSQFSQGTTIQQGLQLPVIHGDPLLKRTFPVYNNDFFLGGAPIRGRSPFKAPRWSQAAPGLMFDSNTNAIGNQQNQQRNFLKWWHQQLMANNRSALPAYLSLDTQGINEGKAGDRLNPTLKLSPAPILHNSVISPNPAVQTVPLGKSYPHSPLLTPDHYGHGHTAFSYDFALKTRRSHSESDVSMSGSTHNCRHCGQTFGLHDRLAKHIASRHRDRCASAESTQKAHKCAICQKTFGRSDMLTRHMRLHTGIKPYGCR